MNVKWHYLERLKSWISAKIAKTGIAKFKKRIAILSAFILSIILVFSLSESAKLFWSKHWGIVIVFSSVSCEIICDFGEGKSLMDRLKIFFGICLVIGLAAEIREAIKSDRIVAILEKTTADERLKADALEKQLSDLQPRERPISYAAASMQLLVKLDIAGAETVLTPLTTSDENSTARLKINFKGNNESGLEFISEKPRIIFSKRPWRGEELNDISEQFRPVSFIFVQKVPTDPSSQFFSQNFPVLSEYARSKSILGQPAKIIDDIDSFELMPFDRPIKAEVSGKLIVFFNETSRVFVIPSQQLTNTIKITGLAITNNDARFEN